LKSFLGFEPRMFMFKVIDRLIAEKFGLFAWEECRPRPVFAYFTLAFALQMREKLRKNFSQGWRKVPVGELST